MSRAVKETVKKWIGYDPAVTATASMTASLAGSTQDLKPKTVAYLKSLFPFMNWIAQYNVTWLLGDVIAGLTGTFSSISGFGNSVAHFNFLPFAVGMVVGQSRIHSESHSTS